MDINIETEISNYVFDQEIAKSCPEFGQYLQLTDQLKTLENQKSSCKDILIINDKNKNNINDRRVQKYM